MFGLTFVTSVITVTAASTLLPCPTHNHRARYADDMRGIEGDVEMTERRKASVTVAKRPSRWIEEKHPL
jgi:hypothetical protein